MRGTVGGACALVIACAASTASAKPKPDPLAVAAAKACGLPVERVTPTEAPTDRKPPAGVDGVNGSWWWDVGDDHIRLDDENEDGRADTRTRELNKPGMDHSFLECEIDERWSGGRWHLVKVTGFDGGDAVETTFKNDRPVHVDRHSEFMQ